MNHYNRSVRLLAVLVSATVWTTSAAASDCVVDNTLDSAFGLPAVTGSLRDCLERVVPGDRVIFDPVVFDLVNSNAATTIHVQYGLPALDDGNVTIEASNRRVTVNGSGTVDASSGLSISSSGNQVRGLAIIGFASSGVSILSGVGNQIGGDRSTGTGPNGQGLRISGNGSYGLEIRGAASSSNLVKGCWIGLDAEGISDRANFAGVLIDGGAHDNTIGGLVAGEANVISGNSFEGITASGTGTDDNVIIGNVIGEGAIDDPQTGRSAVGNGSAGIFLSKGTKGTQVGGDTSGESNSVAYNGGNGVEVRASGSKHNSVRGNRITANSRGGIALFDGSNDAIRPPTIVRVQDLGPNSTGTANTLEITGVTPQDGSMELFNDSGAQGGTILGRSTVLTGPWTTQVDAGEVRNLTATLTDALGNTSPFSVFGLTGTDTDYDGVGDGIEALADTDPDDALDTPAVGGPLDVKKMSIRLNFSSAGKDSLKTTTQLTLPNGFVVDGSSVGVAIAGHSEVFTLDPKGKASSAHGKIALKLSSKGTFLLYGVSKSTLTTILASSGLSDKTTSVDGERWVLPVAVTTGGSVQSGTVTLVYKAKQGKTGSAKK